MLDSIYNDDSNERDFTHKIYGYDNNPKANEIATRNVKAAGLSKEIELKVQAFQQFEQPKDKSIIITNPPYGERISTDDLLGLYQMIGERLKHAFTGNDAWILSYRDECFDQIGLKPSIKVPLYNGALECQFRKYQLFDGKYKAFRSDNEGKEFKPRHTEVRRSRSESDRGDSKRRFEAKGDFKKSFGGKKTFGNKKSDDKKRFESKRDGGSSFGDNKFNDRRKPLERKGDGRRFNKKQDE